MQTPENTCKEKFCEQFFEFGPILEYCFILVSQQPSVNHKTKSNKGI